MIRQIVPALQVLVLLAFVPLVVQSDPVVGTTAFWMTRPIGGPRLLGSKALFIGLLILAPPILGELILLRVSMLVPRAPGTCPACRRCLRRESS